MRATPWPDRLPFRPAGFGFRKSTALCGLLLVGVVVSGCGRSNPPTTSEGTDPTANSANGSQSAPTNDPSPSAEADNRQSTAQSTSRQGSDQKMFGDIPYDVWFDNPLEVAANTQQIASNNSPTVNGSSTDFAGTDMPADDGAGATEPESPPQAASAEDWQELITGTILDAEVKKIRNRLTENLQSVGKYNGNYKDIQIDGATLAALAAIAIQHSDPISWKENAQFVRDLGTQIEENAQGLGRQSYDDTQLPFEQVIVILNGSTPADLPDASVDADFAEKADRAALMRRMEKSFEWMRKNINTEGRFAEEAEETLHETSVLGALSKVIADLSYFSADEEDYADHAQGMIQDSLEMAKAIQSENFEGFTSAMDRIKKRCDECHVGYRFADDF